VEVRIQTRGKPAGGFRSVVDVRDFSQLILPRVRRRHAVLTLSNIYSSAYLSKTGRVLAQHPRGPARLRTAQPDPEDPSRFVTARQRYEQLPSLVRMFPQRIGRTPFYFTMGVSPAADGLRRSEQRAHGRRVVYRTDIFPTL
jgi:hypothetical protein